MSGFSCFTGRSPRSLDDDDGSEHRIKMYKELARLSVSEAPSESEIRRARDRENELAAAARHPRWRAVEPR